jgi:hypothetical protein
VGDIFERNYKLELMIISHNLCIPVIQVRQKYLSREDR